MARLDPREGFQLLKDRVTTEVKATFPQEGSDHILDIEEVDIQDDLDPGDIEGQKKSKLGGTTWGVPVKAKLVLKDKATGKVLDRSKIKIATLPKHTRRHSYIVGGSEYQVDNQWRLKPGVYTRIAQNGQLESRFNFQGKTNLDMIFDPKSRRFQLKHGGSKPPLYPILKAVGIDDDTLQKAWGKEILSANKVTPKGKALNVEKLAINFAKRLDPKKEISNFDDAGEAIRAYMGSAELRPDVTKLTLGKEFTTITPEALTRTSGRLLGVARGDKPDTRDSLQFKDLLSTEDFIAERLSQNARIIKRRLNNNIDRRDKVREIVGPDVFDRPIKEFFAKTSLANTPQQVNPLEMMSGQQRTTITGEGGVKSSHKIQEEAKLVDPSHFGVLDPLHTPESDKTGVVLHLSMSAVKKGKKALVPLHNVKTGETDYVDPEKVNDSIVAMPDEGTWKGGKWVPNSSRVKASSKDNEIRDVDAKKVQYVMKSPSQMFSVATNMIPFLSSDSPNRSSMAGKQMEQAIALKHREPPLVQVDRGDGTGKTFDEFVGRYASHESPVDGKVTKIADEFMEVKAGRKTHKVPLYKDYPLNDKKGLLQSTPVVKVGDKVEKGQVLADTNFTKGGVYAPGVNLNIGYTPWKGYNFEDGVVISETAAKKLTSEHLHKKMLSTKDAQAPGKEVFMSHFSSSLNKEQFEKLDDDGIIKPGMKIGKGDTLIAAVSEAAPTTENQLFKNLHRSLVRPVDNRSVTWDEDQPGEVVNVIKKGKKIQVHVKTEEPMTVGDKMVGRHGNKGIVTRILPDNEMPTTKDGKALEVLMNPIGIAGRMNVGQVLETAATKVAEKRGKPYKVANFADTDNRTKVEDELKAEGISDKETIIDPKDGTEIEGIQVGKQYILKLQHQVDKKMSARDRAGYDRNLIPKGGGKHGAQALGALGMYAMLAHGAKHNIREMQTYKSDKAQNDEVWDAIQTGEPIPPPKTTYGYQKFESYLKGMGVDVQKDGNSLNLVPMTDKQVEEMSSGALKDAGRAVRGYKIGSPHRGSISPEKSGLFDPTITGGLDGDRWSHIDLSEPVPNPLFEKAVRSLTGIRGPQFTRLIEGKEGVTKGGDIVPLGTKGASYGPQSIGLLLDKVNVDADLTAAEERLKKLKPTSTQPINESRRKIKYLKALKKLDMSPRDAYMTSKIPVLPPAMRPLSILEDGALQFDDLNQLYKDVALLDQQVKEMPSYAPDSAKSETRADIYDRMKALTGLGGTLKGRYKGIADIIAGDHPKSGYAQDKLIKRKMDLSMRSTIVPEPSLSLDEVAIPRKAAMEIYKPFIVRELRMSTGSGPLTAKEMVEQNNPAARTALERVVEERPLLMKRDPVLHKYGIQAFKPKIVEGKAIKIHPLVCSGFNADFDGDTMSATVPITEEAVDEARKMFPSKILFNPATKGVMYTPSHEAQVGLYMMTNVKNKTNFQFKDQAALEKAVKAKRLGPNDSAKVGKITTTLDRMKLDATLPKKLQGGQLLTDLDYRFTKKDQGKFFKKMADTDEKAFPVNIDKMKDVGNLKVTHGGFSFGLSDFKVHKDIREPVLREADRKAAGLNLNKPEELNKFVDIYEGAMNKMKTKLETRVKELSTKDSLAMLETAAGIKGKGYAQLTTAPGLFVDAKGEVVASPVRKSYSEGLSASDYWASVSGGRKGIIQRTQSTAKPGYLTKLMMNSVMDTLVQEPDCGTERGISLNIDEPDLVGRYTTSPIKIGKTTVKAGTLVTTDLVNKAKNSKVTRIVSRSPMRCNHPHGVCAKCMGLNERGEHHSQGTNIGVLAAQAVGERGTQLAMKAFHSGGVYEGKAAQEKSITGGGFERAVTLLSMPEKVKGSAKLATTSGKVESVKKDPAGGFQVKIGGTGHYVPADRTLSPGLKKGAVFKKGDPLTRGPINPRELLPLTNMNKVQGYLASELHGLYAPEGIRRRNSEVLVRSLSNVTKVEDSGDSSSWIRGDYAPTSAVNEWNKKNAKRGIKPVKHTPILRGVKTIPEDVQTDWLARLNHENIRSTLVEAAQQGWSSNLHGNHPIPPMIVGKEFGKGTKDKPWAY